MGQRPGGEIRLGDVVDVEVVDADAVALRVAVDGVEAQDAAARRRQRQHLVDGALGAHEAQVLAELPDLVEPVLERVADGLLVAAVGVEARLAEEPAAGNGAVGVGIERAQRRDEVVEPDEGVVLDRREHGEPGVGVRPPGDGRREVVALLPVVVDLGVGAARQPHHAVEQRALRVERAAHVERALDAVEAAALDHDLVGRVGGGPLADGVHQAARRPRAVERRSGPAQHLQALHSIRLDLGRGQRVVAAGEAGAVEIAVQVEAARIQYVVAAQRRARVGGDAGGVAQGLLDALRVLLLHLVGGHHRYRLGQLHQRRVGLGAGGAGGGYEAGVALHVDRAEGEPARAVRPARGARAGRRDHHRGGVREGIDEARAAEDPRQRLPARRRAGEPLRGLAVRRGGEEGDLESGLLAEHRERPGQRAGRHGEGPGRGPGRGRGRGRGRGLGRGLGGGPADRQDEAPRRDRRDGQGQGQALRPGTADESLSPSRTHVEAAPDEIDGGLACLASG